MIQQFWDANFKVKTYVPLTVDSLGAPTVGLAAITGGGIEVPFNFTDAIPTIPMIQIRTLATTDDFSVEFYNTELAAYGGVVKYIGACEYNIPVSGCDKVRIKGIGGTVTMDVVLMATNI